MHPASPWRAQGLAHVGDGIAMQGKTRPDAPLPDFRWQIRPLDLNPGDKC